MSTRKSTMLNKIPLLTPSLFALYLFSAQNVSAYECLLANNGAGSTTGGATSFATNALGCGEAAAAGGDFSTALGRSTVSSGYVSTAVGYFARSIGSGSVAIGRQAKSGGASSTALGYLTNSLGDHSSALGRSASSAGDYSIALGRTASSAVDYSTAVGSYTSTTGDYSTALGYNASSAGYASTALGSRSIVSNTANFGIAIGSDADSDNIGAQSLAEGAIALGNDVINDVPNSMKINVPLRIQADAGTAKLLVEEAHGTTAQRFTAELKNNGGTGFLITDTSQAAASQWQFSSQPNEAFTASFIGTGGPEMQVRKDGAVQFGPGNVVNFNLTANGHMTLLHGSATATAHITSSSREVKKDFEKVDSKEILEKIKRLEITEWRYKSDNEKGRHIGPMAEDFYKLFKLGADNKHVVGTDMASIALIAAKELQEKSDATNAKLEAETQSLKAENKNLQKRLASLEKLVTNLASANGHLSLSGEKVATAK